MQIKMKPYGVLPRALDWALAPIMLSFVGFGENPQWSHWWNYDDLEATELLQKFDNHMMLSVEGNPRASKPMFIRPHLPCFLGGWKKYVVVGPPEDHQGTWYVGWITGPNSGGVCQIPLSGPVRMLVGPGDVKFFALDKDGHQTKARYVGCGEIGDKGPYRWIRLQ